MRKFARTVGVALDVCSESSHGTQVNLGMTVDDHSLLDPLSQPFLFWTNDHQRDGVLVRGPITLLQIDPFNVGGTE
jgi:hypothetical protein